MEDRPELERETARLLSDSGRYSEAIQVYESWLKKWPMDIDAWTQLAATYDEISDLDNSLRVHEQVLAIEPRNLNSRKEKADLLIGMRKFQGALSIYRQFKSEEHDAHTLENYSLLAESLADYKSRADALVVRHKLLNPPTNKDYYDLARALNAQGRDEEALTFLKEGLRRYPKSRQIWFAIARTLHNSDRSQEALAVLKDPRTLQDMEATMLFIELAATLEEYQMAQNFLGDDIEKRFAFGPETLLPLSTIYFFNGEEARSREMLAKVQVDVPLLPILAKTHFQQGNFSAAETSQRKHLANLNVPDATAWVVLGDICKAQGKESEAEAAYSEAHQQMVLKMQKAAEQIEPTPTKETQTTASN
jgi:Flp pilus assembly protein TadD